MSINVSKSFPKNQNQNLLKMVDLSFFLTIFISVFITTFIQNYSYEFYCSIYYIYICIFIYLLFKVILWQSIIFRGWYLSALFILLYTLPHFTVYFLYQDNQIVSDSYQLILNDMNNNIDALTLTNVFLVALIFSHFLFKFFNKKNIFVVKKFYINKITLFFIKVFMLFVLSYVFVKTDWTSVFNSYTVGQSFSLLFGICYMANFLLLIIYSKLLINKKKLGKFTLILSIYIVALGFLGVRQVLFWLILSLILEYMFITKIVLRKKINFFKIFIYILIMLILSGFIIFFRATKDISQFDMEILLHHILYAYLWETTFTVYNLFASLDITQQGFDLFFMKDIKDFFVFLIPSVFFENKSNYLEMMKFADLHDITPFGTYFLLGELILSLKYYILIFIFTSLYGLFSEFFYKAMLRSRNFLFVNFYFFSVIFLYLYPVRGTLPGALKLFFMFGLLFYLLISKKYILRSTVEKF